MFANYRENKARDAISYAHRDGSDVDPAHIDTEEERKRWGYEDLSREEIILLGDRHRGFRYMI